MARKLSSDWKTTGATAEALEITRDHLLRLRPELKEGKHYRNVGRANAARPTYRWHLARIEAYLNSPQHRRA